MDRDQRWDRVKQAYELSPLAIEFYAPSALEGLRPRTTAIRNGS